jgi:hypothetical protein
MLQINANPKYFIEVSFWLCRSISRHLLFHILLQFYYYIQAALSFGIFFRKRTIAIETSAGRLFAQAARSSGANHTLPFWEVPY